MTDKMKSTTASECHIQAQPVFLAGYDTELGYMNLRLTS